MALTLDSSVSEDGRILFPPYHTSTPNIPMSICICQQLSSTEREREVLWFWWKFHRPMHLTLAHKCPHYMGMQSPFITLQSSLPFKAYLQLRWVFLRSGYRIWNWQIFSFCTWKMCQFFLVPMVYDEISKVTWIIFSILYNGSPFSILKIFSLSFIFGNLIKMLLGMIQLLELVDLSLPNLGNSLPYFLKYFFLAVHFFFFLRFC